jgi:SAM-dependent methyltransferase
MPSKDRSRLAYKIRYAVRRPRRVRPYVRRLARDTWLRHGRGARDHVSFYREVMRSEVTKGADAAVGSAHRARWLAQGQMQFDYLVRHGLRRDDRVLEIGCGNLRAGWRLIDHLDTGHYYGIDISPDILLAAQETIRHFELGPKLAHLTLVRDLTFAFLPDAAFTVVHAHSVFSHSPIEVIDECLASVGRVLAPGGFFDFTFDRTEGAEHHVLREDFYYRAETLIEHAAAYGLAARVMDDWERSPHRQSKIRVTHQ